MVVQLLNDIKGVLQGVLKEAYNIVERMMKLNNKMPFHHKILIVFAVNIGLINYYK